MSNTQEQAPTGFHDNSDYSDNNETFIHPYIHFFLSCLFLWKSSSCSYLIFMLCTECSNRRATKVKQFLKDSRDWNKLFIILREALWSCFGHKIKLQRIYDWIIFQENNDNRKKVFKNSWWFSLHDVWVVPYQ
jgi:hypothetical protein